MWAGTHLRASSCGNQASEPLLATYWVLAMPGPHRMCGDRTDGVVVINEQARSLPSHQTHRRGSSVLRGMDLGGPSRG